MSARRTILLGTTVLLSVVGPILGTASAQARTVRSHSVPDRALALHRAENRWHLDQMRGHGPKFARMNRAVHRRCPVAGPAADRAIQGTHMIHGAMEWADNAFLGFHEGFGSR